MAKYSRAKKYTEEDGYWFSTENGTHIHVEEGQTPKEAVEKRFGNKSKANKQPQSYNGARAERNPNFNEEEYGEFFDENGHLIEGKEDEYFEKVHSLDKEVINKNYNQAKEINNYEKVKQIYDRQVEDKGEDSAEARGTKKALDEFKENFDKSNNYDESNYYVEYDDGSIRYGDEYYIDRNDLEEIAGPDALNHIREPNAKEFKEYIANKPLGENETPTELDTDIEELWGYKRPYWSSPKNLGGIKTSDQIASLFDYENKVYKNLDEHADYLLKEAERLRSQGYNSYYADLYEKQADFIRNNKKGLERYVEHSNRTRPERTAKLYLENVKGLKDLRRLYKTGKINKETLIKLLEEDDD